MLSAQECFSKNGIMSQKLGFYEFRPEQLEVAVAVEETIEANKVLVAEAGPGVGKSLAYLVPFIVWAVKNDRKVVVSTYTKALQNQLFVKDLPLLKDALEVDFRFALCLGSENYLCLKKAGFFEFGGLFDEGANFGQPERIMQWLKSTETGLVTDMDFMPEARIWEKFRRESDLCAGKRCRHYERCFFMAAKRKQAGAHILVSNHALLFSALAEGSNVLPDFNALVIDEAHTIEDVATGHFGVEFSSTVTSYFLSRVEDLIKLCAVKAPGICGEDGAAVSLKECHERSLAASDAFFDKAFSSIRHSGVPVEFDPAKISCDGLLDALDGLRRALTAVAEESADDEISEAADAYAERAHKISGAAEMIFRERPCGYVFWALFREMKSARRVSFNASPLEVSAQMKKNIFEKVSPVVLTSATLCASARRGDFTFLKERLGLDDPLEISVDSPYLYKEKVLFYLPEDISDPVSGKEAFKDDITKHIVGIYDIMGGRIFTLFTSYDMLNAVSEAIAGTRPDIYMLKQGDMPRYVLLDVFKKNNKGMLMGTNTFWQGVDVPGSALECVIITRLPFGVPTDPVNSARMRAVKMSGRNPFYEYQLPQALMMFKQGFGRLIRSHADRGVFAVLDPRIRKREYGKKFLDYLPKCDISTNIADVKRFFDDPAGSPISEERFREDVEREDIPEG
jgi:ATP-dependent DNA helicase DinG